MDATAWFGLQRRVEKLELSAAQKQAEQLGSLPARDQAEIESLFAEVRVVLRSLEAEMTMTSKRLDALEQRLGKSIKDRVR